MDILRDGEEDLTSRLESVEAEIELSRKEHVQMRKELSDSRREVVALTIDLNGVHNETSIVCEAFDEVRGELQAQAGNMFNSRYI